MKIPVHNHASVILAYNNQEIVSNVYDSTYPKEIWRGRINLIGGGQSKGDISPKYLLEREIKEEFKIDNSEAGYYDNNFSDIIGSGKGAPKINSFATEKDILLVRDFLLENYKPYNDFLVTFPGYKNKPPFKIIISSYACKLSEKVMNCFRRNISSGKSLVSEGFLKTTNLQDIQSGKILTAWAAGIIIEDFFCKEIPNPEKIIAQKIGLPKSSLEEYFNEYDYFIR